MYLYASEDFLSDATVLAKIYSEECRQFKENCFLDIKPSDTRITFLGHGMVKNKTPLEVVFGDRGLSPSDFVKNLVELDLPENISTIDIIACYVGLLHDRPSYLAEVAQKLSENKKYQHISVRGITYIDLEKRFVQMSYGFGKKDNDSYGLSCLLFTEEQAKARARYDSVACDYIERNKDLRKRINRLEGILDHLKSKLDEFNALLEKLKDKGIYSAPAPQPEKNRQPKF